MRVCRARILWEVAECSGATHFAGCRVRLAGQHSGQRGLAGTIASDQTHSVTGRDPESGVVKEQARTSAQLKVGGFNHNKTSLTLGLHRVSQLPDR